MKDLHPQFELLIRYADGDADADMQRRAAELINSDAEAAEFYQSLLVTSQPLNEIHAERAQQQAAVPQKFIDQINNAQPVAVNSAAADRSSENVMSIRSTATDNTGSAASNSDGQSGRFGLMALAASLFFGLIGGAILYGTVTGLPSEKPAVLSQTNAPEWVRLVADYHRLYVRETVTASARESADAVSLRVAESLQANFNVPSLDQQGLEFRRAQWLAIDDQPLLQLAYLPKTGKPLALCVLKKSIAQDIAAEYGETGGMRYVHWQSGEHAVVIVGSVSLEMLEEINGVVESQLL